MEYLFLFLLITLTIIAYISGGKDFGSPYFISCLIYLLSFAVGILFFAKWNIDFQFITGAIILSGLLSFGIGQWFGKKNVRARMIERETKRLEIKKWNAVVFFLIGMGTFAFGLYELYQGAILAGYTGTNLLYFIRVATLTGLLEQNLPLLILVMLNQAFTYFISFIMVNNFLHDKKTFFKKDAKLPLLLMPFILINFFSGGKIEFIKYFSVVLIMVLVLVKKKPAGMLNRKKSNKMVLKAAFVSVFSIGVVFGVVSLLRVAPGSQGLSLWDNLGIYFGSPIPAFDNLLQKDFSYSTVFGQESLNGLRNLLIRFGFKFERLSTILPFVIFDDKGYYYTNIYTQIKSLMADFGFAGMLLMQCLMGVFYGIFYKNVTTKNNRPSTAVLYAYFGQFLILQYCNPDFFNLLLSVTQITVVLSIILCQKFLLTRKK